MAVCQWVRSALKRLRCCAHSTFAMDRLKQRDADLVDG